MKKICYYALAAINYKNGNLLNHSFTKYLIWQKGRQKKELEDGPKKVRYFLVSSTKYLLEHLRIFPMTWREFWERKKEFMHYTKKINCIMLGNQQILIIGFNHT